MTSSIKNLIPNIPPIQQDIVQPVKTPNGVKYQIHPDWHNALSQLTTFLQKNFSQEGIKVSNQTSTNIALLNTAQSNASFLYDSDEGVMKVNNATGTTPHTYKQVSTRPEQLTSAQIAAIPTSQINGTWVFNTDTSKLHYGINNGFKEVAYT